MEGKYLITQSCQCEHESHFDRSKKTPNGNPSHVYGQKFNIALISEIKTDYGMYRVCPDCKKDCWSK